MEATSSAPRPSPNPVAPSASSDVSGGNSQQLTFLETYALVSREWAKRMEAVTPDAVGAGSVRKCKPVIEALQLCAAFAEILARDDDNATPALIQRLQDEKRRRVERQSQSTDNGAGDPAQLFTLGEALKRAGVDIEEDKALVWLAAAGVIYEEDGRWYPSQEAIDKGYFAPAYPQ